MPYLITSPEVTACDGKLLEKGGFWWVGEGRIPASPQGERPGPMERRTPLHTLQAVALNEDAVGLQPWP